MNASAVVPLAGMEAKAGLPARTLTAGDLVADRYRVLGVLGRGGMGTVYLVEHTRLGQQHALKVLHAHLSEDAGMLQRFQREAQVVAGLTSEHIVRIFDSGSLPNGTPYFVMERLVGADLRALLLASGQMPVIRAANLAIDACLGLHAAHQAGLVHRDLKPENVFVTRGDDGRDVCKLLDFGIAWAVQSSSTAPGTLLGSARYMAPEQIGASSEIGPSTDLFSLGVTLYECVAGAPPFEADTLERLFFKIMNEAPQRLDHVRPKVGRELADIVHRCLEKAPEQRYPSALSLAAALAPLADRARHSKVMAPLQVSPALGHAELTLADDPVVRVHPRKARVRPRLLAMAGGAAALVALMIGFVVRERRAGGELEPPAARTGASGLPLAALPSPAASVSREAPSRQADEQSRAPEAITRTAPAPSIPASASALQRTAPARGSARRSVRGAPAPPRSAELDDLIEERR